jgi:hypothetical protein
VRITVVQRLLVHGVGDYYFAVPAPVRDVRASADSQSEPGRREGQILWQGFSQGNRLLGARAELDPGAASRALPLRLTLSRRGNEVTLVVRNATLTRVPSFSAAAVPGEVARFLDTLRGPQGRPRPDTFVTVVGAVRQVTRTAAAPVYVEGELGTAPRVAFRRLLTDAAPSLHVTARVASGARTTLRLTARPDVPPARVRPPGGGTWAAYVRATPGLDRRAFLDTALETALDLALQGQYDTLLANPDRTGRRAAVYVYTLAAPAPRARPPLQPRRGGNLGTAALLAALVAAATGAIVWWAHS